MGWVLLRRFLRCSCAVSLFAVLVVVSTPSSLRCEEVFEPEQLLSVGSETSSLNYDDTADCDWGRDATFLKEPDPDLLVKHLKEEAEKKKQPSIEKELQQEIVDLFICHLQWYPTTNLLVFSSEELLDIDS
jgi:hypothetical protein